MKNVHFTIICCILYCNNSEAIESAIEANYINLEDEIATKLSHDRDIIYRLCAEHKEIAIGAYNKVHSNETFRSTIPMERYFLNEYEKEIEKCSMGFNKMDNTGALKNMLDNIHYKHSKKIEEIETVRKKIREELGISEEDYKASLDSIQQYSFLPSIAELESIVGENEYLKVMSRYCNARKFNISLTRVMGENERCSIRKTLDIKYDPQKMDDGSIFYPASYFSRTFEGPIIWEGLIVNGRIALQVESFRIKERKKIDSNDGHERYLIQEKTLMAFKLLDWNLASSAIKNAEKRLKYLQKKRKSKK